MFTNLASSSGSGSNVHYNRESTEKDFYTHWNEWRLQEKPGEGERRDIAIEVMTKCVSDKTETLDLRGLNLTSIPEILPSHIKRLRIAENKIMSLPKKLPQSLISLNCAVNKLKYLESDFPESIIEIIASHNSIEEMINNLPDNLEKLDVSYNEITCLPDKLPQRLELLFVEHNKIVNLTSTFPLTLRTINAQYNRIETIPNGLFLLAKDSVVFLEGNQLLDEVTKRITESNNDPNYHGPKIRFYNCTPYNI